MDANLIVTIHDKGYKVVTCPDGYCFTDWDKKDANEFSASRLMYAPLSFDLEPYYTMTDGAAQIIEDMKTEE